MPGFSVPTLTEGVTLGGGDDGGGESRTRFGFFFRRDEDTQEVEGHFFPALDGDVFKHPIHLFHHVPLGGSAMDFQDVPYPGQFLVPLRLRKQCPACFTVYDLYYHDCDLRRG
jgi:hypothetical protein